MRRRYSIGFLTTALVLFIAIAGAYQISFDQAKERAAEEKVAKAVDDHPSPSVATEGTAVKEDCYYLMEVNGYVVAYLDDKETAYEYTDIQIADLPYELQNEIKNGKYIKDTKELYSFLENYTS